MSDLPEHGGAPAKNPCGSCPYRKDVPSGVWHASEYEKLPSYDEQSSFQPAFFCHQQDGRLCAGWVGCHDMEESIGLRLARTRGHLTSEGMDVAMDYVSPVPLWESGQAAHDHGVTEIEQPGEKASRIVDKVIRKHGVLREDLVAHSITVRQK